MKSNTFNTKLTTIENLQSFLKTHKKDFSNTTETVSNFKWYDVYFGYRDDDFCECDFSSPYAKRDWDEDARQLNYMNLKRGKEVLTLRFKYDYKEINDAYNGRVNDAYTLSYQKDKGFIDTARNLTLKTLLDLSEEDNKTLCKIFETEFAEHFSTKPTKPTIRRGF